MGMYQIFFTASYSESQVLIENHFQQQQPFNSRLSGTTRVGRYQKKHSPAHTHPGQRPSFITFLHLQWSTASSLFSLRAWQSSRTTSFQVLFGLPLGLEPSTSYSMHFFTQSSWKPFSVLENMKSVHTWQSQARKLNKEDAVDRSIQY